MDEQPERRNRRRDHARDPTAGSDQRQHESILACDGRAGMDAPRSLGTVQFFRAPPGFSPTQDALKELPVWNAAPRAHPICYPLLVTQTSTQAFPWPFSCCDIHPSPDLGSLGRGNLRWLPGLDAGAVSG